VLTAAVFGCILRVEARFFILAMMVGIAHAQLYDLEFACAGLLLGAMLLTYGPSAQREGA